MLSDKDFQKLWFLYKTEGAPNNISIQSFCAMQNVPYLAFDKWHKSHCKKIVPLQVDGMPSVEEEASKKSEDLQSAAAPSMPKGKCIFVKLHFPNGMDICQRCYGYDQLRTLVHKLEVLC